MYVRLQRLLILSVAASVALSLTLHAGASGFIDVGSNDWYEPAVSFVVGAGLFGGVGNERFAPQQSMSRAMFYTVLARMSGYEPDNTAGTNLSDVPQNQWYTGSVIWALRLGLTSCKSATEFGVNDPIMRVELCQSLARYDRYAGVNRLNMGATATFPDLGKLDGEQRTSVAACQAAGVVNGRSDGRFDPFAGTSRAEVAEMIKNYCKLEAKPNALSEKPDEWTGRFQDDFPLCVVSEVTPELVRKLNRTILSENTPALIAPFGTTLDGNEKHLTNYGSGGISDCYNVTTNRYNKNNEIDEGVSLVGKQEYYGYSLQTSGVAKQDRWHEAAEDSGKDAWQCTWWVWGRAAQYLEEARALDFRTLCEGEDNFGHGKSYYNGLKPYFESDLVPTPNSIISWDCGSYGHVAYVEAVDEKGIWVTMADSGHTWRGVTYIERVDSETNPYPLNWYAVEYLNGFNHLDRPLNVD